MLGDWLSSLNSMFTMNIRNIWLYSSYSTHTMSSECESLTLANSPLGLSPSILASIIFLLLFFFLI